MEKPDSDVEAPASEVRTTAESSSVSSNDDGATPPPTFYERNPLHPLHSGKDVVTNLPTAAAAVPATTPPPSKSFTFMDPSVAVVVLIVFVGDSSRGVLYPVLWSLCSSLGGTLVDLGYLVAMFSLGRLLFATPLGYACDRVRHRLPLVVAQAIVVFGAVIWANAYVTRSLACLYVGQFVLGCGSGSLGVTRAFIVEQCDPKQRTPVLALLTAVQYAGFTVSPALGSAMILAATSGSGVRTAQADTVAWTFALPAYLIGLLALLSIVGLLTVFKDFEEAPEAAAAPPVLTLAALQQPPPTEPGAGAGAGTAAAAEETKIEAGTSSPATGGDATASAPAAGSVALVAVALLLLNVTTKGSIAVYETLGAETAVSDYGMTTPTVGVMITACGAFGFVMLLLFKAFWTARFTDTQLILGGIATMALANLITLTYAPSYKPPFANFVTATVLMYALGYPIGHTAVLGAFSKAQKHGRQGALMGWFASAGSLARIVLPVTSGYLEQWADGSSFNLVLLLLAGSYLAVLVIRPRLVRMTEEEGAGAGDGRDARVASEAPPEGAVAKSTGISERVRGACRAASAWWRPLPWYDRAQVAVCVALMVLAVGGLWRLAPGMHNATEKLSGKVWDVDAD